MFFYQNLFQPNLGCFNKIFVVLPSFDCFEKGFIDIPNFGCYINSFFNQTNYFSCFKQNFKETIGWDNTTLVVLQLTTICCYTNQNLLFYQSNLSCCNKRGTITKFGCSVNKTANNFGCFNKRFIFLPNFGCFNKSFTVLSNVGSCNNSFLNQLNYFCCFMQSLEEKIGWENTQLWLLFS